MPGLPPVHKPPQPPGAPGWKDRPKGGAAGFAAFCTLVAGGILMALGVSEGDRRDVYLDSAGIPTTCKGIIGPEVTRRWKAQGKNARFTDAECKSLEANYLKPMLAEMSRCLPDKVKGEISYGQMLALGHWRYNTGAFCHSGVGRYLIAGDHVRSCKAMDQWTWITLPKGKSPRGKHKAIRDAAGKVVKVMVDCKDDANRCSGLAKRRFSEVSWCLSALN